MDSIANYLLIFIPLAIAQFTLTIVALIHVLRHPYYRMGNKTMWVIIVIFVSTIGPIAYFVFGRGEKQ